MELKVIDAKGQVSGSLAVSDALFAREYNEALVHQLVTAYLANARSGNRAQKTRAEVNHSRCSCTIRGAMGMNQQRLTQVILAPIVSEKSNVLAEKRNQMTFKVLANATKPEIKAAVELLFGVRVADVTTVTIKGKIKRFGRTLGRRSDVKKAYVSLAAGQELDLEAAAAAADKE